MKKQKFKLITILSLGATTILSSCLKDSRYVAFEDSPNLIELPATAFSGVLETATFMTSATPSNLPVLINLASPKPSSQPITVKFKIDADALAAYNSANGTNYQLLPPANYNTSLTATIPAGKREVNLNVVINGSLFDLTKSYALPLTIIDAGPGNVISANYKTIIYSFSVQSQYEGAYTMKGYVLRAGDPVLTGNYNNIPQGLSTINANSIGGLNQVWSSGTPVTGTNPITLTVDPATNKVTISSTVNATLTGDPTYDNRYDPATKTFYISFYWNAGKTSRDATDTLVYTGPIH